MPGFAGPSEDSESFRQELRGVIPRSFEYIFDLIQRQQELVSFDTYLLIAMFFGRHLGHYGLQSLIYIVLNYVCYSMARM